MVVVLVDKHYQKILLKIIKGNQKLNILIAMNFSCQESRKNSFVYTYFRNCSWSIQMKVYMSGHGMWNVSHITGCFFLLNWMDKQKPRFQFLLWDTIWYAAKELGIWYAMFWTVTSREIFYFSKALSQKDINTAYLP